MRPFSGLSLIFDVLLPVQVPCLTTSPSLAIAAGAALKIPATIRPAIANRAALRMNPTSSWCRCSVGTCESRLLLHAAGPHQNGPPARDGYPRRGGERAPGGPPGLQNR